MPGEYLQAEGDFLVEARKPKSGWLGKSKEKQTPYIQIGFTVLEDVVNEGAEITWFGYLSDKAIERTIDTLVAAFGFDGDLSGLVAGKTSFEGMRARITVEAEEYEGKKRYKVRWLNPEHYDGPPSLSEEEAKMLVAGLQKKTLAAAKKAASEQKEVVKASAKPPSKKEPAPVGPPEDDVPF